MIGSVDCSGSSLETAQWLELAMEQLKELQQKNSLLMKLSGHVPSAKSSGFVDTLLVMFRALGAETLQHLKNLKTLLPLPLGFVS